MDGRVKDPKSHAKKSEVRELFQHTACFYHLVSKGPWSFKAFFVDHLFKEDNNILNLDYLVLMVGAFL